MGKSPKISSFSIIVVFLCLALAGIAVIPLLPVKLNPSRTLPRLSIYYTLPQNSARVIEMSVTSKLEAMLARIRGIKEISSTSGNGWGRIFLELDRHTDVDVARFEASAIIRQTWPQLPQGLSYPVIEMSRPDNEQLKPFISYTLNAAATPVYIQRYAEEQIKPRLNSIPGIYKITIQGATPLEWLLEYDNRQLAVHGITTNAIQQAIEQFYRKEFLGTASVDVNRKREWIRLALQPDAPADGFNPALIEVTNKEGKLIRLDQLLTVTRREEMPDSYYRINGLNSIYLTIQADESANQLKLAKAVKAEMAQVEEWLPPGYEIHVSYDSTKYISRELDKIYMRTALTLLILLVFVFLISRELNYLLLILVSLSVNLGIAFILYYLLGLEMQLYSLAGITISLSLVIDNTIVMTEHIRSHANRRAFLSILAATLTTMGALVIIFFLDENIRLNLQDFAAVVIINLGVSLLIALFLVPALIDKLGLTRSRRMRYSHRQWQRRLDAFSRRMLVCFNRAYAWQIRVLSRWRALAYVVLVLAFGLPVFLLPEKLEYDSSKKQDAYTAADSFLINRYNDVIGGETYKNKVKPVIDKALGGTLRLFVQKVYAGSYFTRNEELVLHITASMPNGTTLQQMNSLIMRMEAFLSGYRDIRQFQTVIYSARQASIAVYFTKAAARTAFPYTLKSNVIGKALELGGGSWGVYGLMDQGFSNDVRETVGSYRIEMTGFNYDELYDFAESLRGKLLDNRRIREVNIDSEFSWWKDDYQEYFFALNKERLAQAGILPLNLFASLYPILRKDVEIGTIVVDNEVEKLKLSSRQAAEYDLWSVQYMPQLVQDVPYKLADLSVIAKSQAPQKVAKINQQYKLCLQYEYIGSSKMGKQIQTMILKDFNKKLPMGYSAQTADMNWSWGSKDNKQYLLLLLIIVIIFFTTSILFNSLRQPLAVIGIIPISFIGVFLTFYWFKLNFDQGGFASFVLLCGITVNACIYILNEYNQIRADRPQLSPVSAYIKAWNAKIIPIFLTVISTIFGFIPFMLGADKESFWFPLAAGTIGGLIMSLIGIFFYLPLSLPRTKKDGIEEIRS